MSKNYNKKNIHKNIYVIIITAFAIILFISSCAPSVVKPKLFINDTLLKYTEMLNTIVRVESSENYSGSGVIIGKTTAIIPGATKYVVLTNHHVIEGTDPADIQIVVFQHQQIDISYYNVEVIAIDDEYDLAMLTFQTNHNLPIAKLANQKIMNNIHVFDNIFAIGCQYGYPPAVTLGLISRIFYDQDMILYTISAQTMPGSSGGGAFKEHNGHYYLIGISFQMEIADNDQFIPHMSYVISMTNVQKFIDENSWTD